MNSSVIKNSKLLITKVGFGCSNFGGIGSDPKLVGKGDSEEEAFRILDLAYQHGISFFDTATTYGNGKSEEILGNWIRIKKIPRESIIISSKVNKKPSRFHWHQKGLPRKHILKQIKTSLKRMQLTYLDIFFIHAPDPSTPIVEILSTLNECINTGLTRAIGVSNVDVNYLKNSINVSRSNGWAKYSIVQNSYNYLDRKDEHDLIPFCKDNDILYIGYSPLAGGILSGKYQWSAEFPKNSRLFLRESLYRSYLSEENFEIINKLKKLANTHNLTMPSLMYQWLYNNNKIDSFLIGARTPLQFQSLCDALAIGNEIELP